MEEKFTPGGPYSNGFTLMEVLIALLVLAIGLVGLSALLLNSLSNVHSSTHFSLASSVALDFEERVWREMTLASSAEPRELDENGCLSNTRLAAVRTATEMQWRNEIPQEQAWNWFQGSARLVMPDLQIVDLVANNTCSSALYPCITVAFEVTWSEARFDDVEAGRESYRASFSVPCRPEFD